LTKIKIHGFAKNPGIISTPFFLFPAGEGDDDDADENEAAKKEHEDDEPGV